MRFPLFPQFTRISYYFVYEYLTWHIGRDSILLLEDKLGLRGGVGI